MERRRKRSAHTDLFGSKELAGKTRCAVIVAHPDDDVIGAGVLISRLSNVTVLHITDGVPEDNPSRKLDHGDLNRLDLVRARRQESRDALALANVAAECIIEFGFIFEPTPLKLTELARRIASFLRFASPDIVLTHPYEGGHPEHDATAFATHAAVQLLRRSGFKPPSIFEFALHPGQNGTVRVLDFLPGKAAEVTTLLLDKKARDLKREMLDCFAERPEIQRDQAFRRERFRRPPVYNFDATYGGTKMLSTKVAGVPEGSNWETVTSEAWSSLFPDQQTFH